MRARAFFTRFSLSVVALAASLASPAGLALLRSAVRHGEQSLAETAGSRSRTENQP